MSLDPSTLDAVLESAVADGRVPGIAAIVTDRDGTLYEGTAGVLQEGGAPVDGRTIFRWASCTKALTSVAALQLIEQGRLGLEDEVRTHLPEFADLQVLDGFDGDTPVLRAPSRPPVVRELMTHSAGLTYFFTNAAVARFHEVTGIPHVLTGKLDALTRVPLAADPGVRWDYGTNTDWLGLLVERLSGQTLDAYLDEHVVGPLGMEDVTFSPTDEQRARAMPIHVRTPDGGLAATEIDLAPEPDWAAGGHGLFGTADAYGRLIRALLRGGELDGARILREETVELAFSDQLAGVPMPTDGIKSAAPEFCNDVPPLPFAQSWGLGLHLTLEDVPGMRRAGSGDWAGLFNLYFWIDRGTGVGGMVLTQVLPFFDAGVVQAFVELEAAVYAQVGATAAA
ncbi:serine hydrolase [Patulibacter sp.]|uniref:serine hydrolase domain-containing protein n=1 Tax=Patulibacter sp. TaxID=1912859 RepID=UPI002728111A|nr:serine hydrolase domain-containing protein [Patulibacter sp.]MDO9408071.1 serine hydrolase domain-containing protein [Patulibacter sp.]